VNKRTIGKQIPWVYVILLDNWHIGRQEIIHGIPSKNISGKDIPNISDKEKILPNFQFCSEEREFWGWANFWSR
jgi:hypothetical protein